ncbi:MAG: PQQ-binding-like beta-propeller repeat protein [Planctomycetota bacterium]
MPSSNRFTLSLLTFLAFSSVCHADWPDFRGPSRDGIVTVDLPTKWSPDSNVLWKSDIPGEGWSSPIVVGDRIYLTAAVPQADEGFELQLICLNADSGKTVFQKQLFNELSDAPRIHRKNSHASPTPIFDGTNIFVHFGHQGTACVSPDGDVVWKNDSLAYPPVHGNGGTPVIVDNLLIFSRDGADIAEVTALNKQTGEIAWQSQRDVEVQKSFSFCTPLVIEVEGKTQLILPGSNVVQSLDPATGEEFWRLSYDGYSVIPRPIYHEGLVFVCTGYNRPSILAIDPTGSGDVTKTHLRWQSKDRIPHTPSLIAYKTNIAMISDQGVATMVDAKTGEQVWRTRVDGGFSASPLLSGSMLYFLSEGGDCTVLDISGSQPKEVTVNSMDERCLASMAVYGKDLLLRSAQSLYRIGNR